MRNKYSKEFEETMRELAPSTDLDRLLWYAYSYFGYEINKGQLRQYLSRRHIRYKDYNRKRARDMGIKLPIGTEYVKDDGMILIKVSKNKWMYKQRYLYEQYHNVKLRNDQYVIFLNQDRTDFSKDNLKAISRHESAIMSNLGLFSTDRQVTETGNTVAKMIVKLKDIEKGE